MLSAAPCERAHPLPSKLYPPVHLASCHSCPFCAPSHIPHAQTKSRLTVGLEDSEDLVSGNALDLGDTVRVTENDTDLGWGETSSGELEDLVGNLLRGGLGPRRLRTTVRESRSAHTLSFRVHSGGQQVLKRRAVRQHTVPFWLAIR